MTSLTINPELPKRGEIWLVNFDPTVGAEIKKVRPAVVISSDSVGKLPIKLIAPITDRNSNISINAGKEAEVNLENEPALVRKHRLRLH